MAKARFRHGRGDNPRFHALPMVPRLNILAGPRGLPADVLAALSRAARAALAEPGTRERLAAAGVDPAEPTTTPEGTRDFLRAEVAKFRGIVDRAGLRLGR